MRNKTDCGVFLKYASQECGDGLGAQAQRIMGIYSASHSLGLGYIHEEIQTIELNPGDPFSTVHERAIYLEKANSLFCLPSSTSVRPARSIRLQRLTRRDLFFIRQLNRMAKTFRFPIEVELPLSLPWSDENPDTYSVAADLIRPRIQMEGEGKIVRVDVHIRRALSPKVGNSGHAYDRHVSTDWYRGVVREIVSYLSDGNLQYEIRIHTDIPKARWKVPEDTSAGTLAMWKHHKLLDDDGYLVDQSEDLEKAFNDLGPITVAREWDPVDVIKSMATADILVICASSLSYVAGLIRGDKLTVAPIFFHTNPTNWQTISAEIIENEKIALHNRLSQQFRLENRAVHEK